jgi:hypothetical protein
MDHNDIYTIIQRLAVLEGRTTPATVKKGLNSQQKAVPQMPALFKMSAQGPVLGGNADKKAPSSGYMVGSGESAESEAALSEQVTSEDRLDKVKKSFADYLDSITDEKNDADLKERVAGDADLKDKVKKDSSIVVKQTSSDAVKAVAKKETAVTEQPAAMPMPVSAPVKTITLEDGRTCEIHGDEHRGFEIRHGGNTMKSRFKNLDHAQMALEMYIARNRQQDESADYIEEA